MDKWLYELCHNRRVVVPKFELMNFIELCNKNGIIPSIEADMYDVHDKDNPFRDITVGVIITAIDELDVQQGLVIAKYKNKADKYNKLIKSGYDVFNALRVLRI